MNDRPVGVDDAEVVVVGAGPAGTAAAITLARLGRDTVLIDQSEFPRDKPCGDALWSRAVKTLREFEIDELLDSAVPVECTRVVRAYGGKSVERSTDRLSPRPLCIPRAQLDAHLVDAALESGARFVLGRVESLKEAHGQVEAVVIRRQDGTYAEIHARAFVAADGVTSRMRRLMGSRLVANPVRAYAVRQYFRSELPVEPVFEVHMPVVAGGQCLPGYAWVFPVSEHVANVGTGWCIDGTAGRPGASLRNAFTEFVDGLRADEPSRFGQIEEIGALKGAPLAVHFSPDAVQQANVYFAGDAANLTDPLIGEGIAAALESGRLVGLEIERRLKSRDRGNSLGVRLNRSFPRLGQDAGAVARNYCEFVAGAGPGLASSIAHPLLGDALATMMRGSDVAPGIADAVVFGHLPDDDGILSQALADLSGLALDTYRTELPLATELLFRRLWSGAGPTVATTAIVVEFAHAGAIGAESVRGALACESLALAVELLAQVETSSTPRGTNIGNSYATLIADFSLTRWLSLMSGLGHHETSRFAAVGRLLHEQAARVHETAWDLDRSEKAYFDDAVVGSGAIHAFAAGLGSRLAGVPECEELMEEYGRNLGIAMRISDDLNGILNGDDSTARLPGEVLRCGEITLPVIYALEEDPSLRELLSPKSVEDFSAELVERVRGTTAPARCGEMCLSFIGAARASIEELDSEIFNRLSEFAKIALADRP